MIVNIDILVIRVIIFMFATDEYVYSVRVRFLYKHLFEIVKIE